MHALRVQAFDHTETLKRAAGPYVDGWVDGQLSRGDVLAVERADRH